MGIHDTTVKFDKLHGDREAQASTTMLSRTATVNLAESLEQVFGLVLAKASPSVNDFESNHAFVAFVVTRFLRMLQLTSYKDFSLLRELDGVAYYVQ